MIKKVLFIASILICSLAHSPADAFDDYKNESAKPAITSARNIAMIFHKLSGEMPDFYKIAKDSTEYKNAEPMQKASVLNSQVDELKSIYNLISLQEPIVVEVPVKLSKYSYSNKGFFVENFKERTFFSKKHGTTNYAMIPGGLMDKQWLSVENEKLALQIEEVNKKYRQSPLTMMLYLAPTYSDSSKQTKIGKKDYWLIATDVKDVSLYLPKASFPIWESINLKTDDSNNKRLQELRNLRQ